MEQLTDVISESAVLSAVINNGADCYVDLAELINCDTFTDEQYAALWKCFAEIFKGETKKTDIPSILVTAKDMGLGIFFDTETKQKTLKRICGLVIEPDSALRFAKKLKKLQIARELGDSLDKAKKEILSVNGGESTAEIISKAEKPIFDAINRVDGVSAEGAVHISAGLRDLIQHIEDNPNQSLGIPSGFPEWDESIGGGLTPGIHVVGARLKGGKAQPLYSTVYTKNGPKTMKEIEVGDEVWTPSGKLSKVIAVHPQGLKDTYRIHFKYGDYVDCCEDHLWKVMNKRKRVFEVLSLKDIKNHGKSIVESTTGTKWYVPILETGPDFEIRDLPVDPYVLGVLIGDGTCKDCTLRLTNIDTDIINKFRSLLPDDVVLNTRTKDIEYAIVNKVRPFPLHKSSVKKVFDDLGLSVNSHDKFIPEIYKHVSLEQRLELIRGLMDTDGSACKKENNSVAVEYTTTSLKLANDFKWLIQSIGGIAVIKPRNTSYTGSTKKFPSYRIRIFIDNPAKLFSCQRKIDLCRYRTKSPLKRAIKSIEKLGQVECKCITIADPDGLYLTDNFIVTHNSHFADNAGVNIAGKGYPVLILDVEMQRNKHQFRLLSLFSGVPVLDIKKGLYVKRQADVQKVRKAEQILNDLPYTYIWGGVMSMDERISHMRRWILRHVGYGDNGKIKPCVIFYDQLKVTDPTSLDSMAEHQALGFQVDGLHNFSIQYEVPIVALTQLNRDGINNQSTAAVANSDKIAQACTSLTFLKWKSPEEIAKDGPELGNKKMIVVAGRDGAEHLGEGQYIHVGTNLSIARMFELGSTTRPKKTAQKFDIEAVQEINF